MMASLSKAMKARMAECLADHAFKEKLKVGSDAVRAASDELYVHVFGAENIKLMEKLPPQYFVRSEMFFINVNGQVHCVVMSEKRPIPQNAVSAYRSQIPVMSIDDELVRKYVAAEDAQGKLSNDQHNAQLRAEAAMANINTFNQLWKLWPEAQSVIGHFEQKPERALLPAVVINDLNKELGLPAGSEK